MADHIRHTHLGEPSNVRFPNGVAGGSLIALNADGTAKVGNDPAADVYFGYMERDVATGGLGNPVYNCEVPVKAASAIPALSPITFAANGQAQANTDGAGGTLGATVGRVFEAIGAGEWGRAYIATPV